MIQNIFCLIFLKEVMNLGRDFAVLAIDIDYFKQVNDRYGHGQGDAVLKTLASLMKNNFRDEDICCRIGGEEFIVLMTTSDAKVAYNAAERLRKTIESSNFNFIEPITISVGIAFWPRSSDDVTEVFKMADNKLYQAKIILQKSDQLLIFSKAYTLFKIFNRTNLNK